MEKMRKGDARCARERWGDGAFKALGDGGSAWRQGRRRQRGGGEGNFTVLLDERAAARARNESEGRGGWVGRSACLSCIAQLILLLLPVPRSIMMCCAGHRRSV